MELTVVVEQVEGNGYRASSGEPIPMSADGASREEAVLKLQESVAARVAAGLEIIRIRVPTFTPVKPLWPDDEFTRAWLEGIAEARRQADAEVLPWETPEDGGA
jgi:hypothetical protein